VEWDLDADGVIDETTSNGGTLQYQYDDDGVYSITVIVTDNEGAHTTSNIPVTIQNRAPVAQIDHDHYSGFAAAVISIIAIFLTSIISTTILFNLDLLVFMSSFWMLNGISGWVTWYNFKSTLIIATIDILVNIVEIICEVLAIIASVGVLFSDIFPIIVSAVDILFNLAAVIINAVLLGITTYNNVISLIIGTSCYFWLGYSKDSDHNWFRIKYSSSGNYPSP